MVTCVTIMMSRRCFDGYRTSASHGTRTSVTTHLHLSLHSSVSSGTFRRRQSACLSTSGSNSSNASANSWTVLTAIAALSATWKKSMGHYVMSPSSTWRAARTSPPYLILPHPSKAMHSSHATLLPPSSRTCVGGIPHCSSLALLACSFPAALPRISEFMSTPQLLGVLASSLVAIGPPSGCSTLENSGPRHLLARNSRDRICGLSLRGPRRS